MSAEGTDDIYNALCIYMEYFLTSKSYATVKASPFSSETIKRTCIREGKEAITEGRVVRTCFFFLFFN